VVPFNQLFPVVMFRRFRTVAPETERLAPDIAPVAETLPVFRTVQFRGPSISAWSPTDKYVVATLPLV
jgi:hypothetical protein